MNIEKKSVNKIIYFKHFKKFREVLNTELIAKNKMKEINIVITPPFHQTH
jgi:hypothetical protein